MSLLYTYSSGIENSKIKVNYNIMTEAHIYDSLPQSKKVADTYETSLDLSVSSADYEIRYSYIQYFNNIQNIRIVVNPDVTFYSILMILPKNLSKTFTLYSINTNNFNIMLYYYWPITEEFLNWVKNIKIISPNSYAAINIYVLDDYNKNLTLSSGHDVSIIQANKIYKDLSVL